MRTVAVTNAKWGVGKSTTARALADTLDSSIHIDVDEFRHMVRGGLVLPGMGEWPDELRRQVRLARATAIEMARRYATAGFTVVIDDFWDPDDLAEYADLARVDQLLSPGTALARAIARSEREPDAPLEAADAAALRTEWDEVVTAVSGALVFRD